MASKIRKSHGKIENKREKGVFCLTEKKGNDSPCRVGGRLGAFLLQWQATSTNAYILDLIARGYCIEVNQVPPEQFLVTRVLKNADMAAAMTNLLQEMTDQAVISSLSQKESKGGFYSHIFLRKKQSGRFRLILNLKLFNRAVRYKKFKMETIFTNKRTTDSRDIHSHNRLKRCLFIHSHQGMLQDFSKVYSTRPKTDNLLPFQCFTFRASISSKNIHEGVSRSTTDFKVRRDPDNTISRRPTLIRKNIRGVGKVFKHNTKPPSEPGVYFEHRSNFLTAQEVTFLGYIVDSLEAKIFLPTAKREALMAETDWLILNPTASIRKIMMLLGQMTAAIPAVTCAQTCTSSSEVHASIIKGRHILIL